MTDIETNQAGLFVTGKPLQPSPIFANKAGKAWEWQPLQPTCPDYQ